MDPINTLFKRMNDWRNFPDYQLERRADIFFSLYLPEVFKAKLDLKILEDIVPEFPIHKRTIDVRGDGEDKDQGDTKDGNRSYKVDYFALSADGTKAILVELKTEVESRREKQDDYLNKARVAGATKLLEGIRTIFLTTNAKTKYYCLLKRLEKMGQVSIPPEVDIIMSSAKHRGLTRAAKGIEITTKAADCSLVYIQPDPTRPQDISLKQFADVVKRHDDALSQRFAHSLYEWSQMPAGNNRQ